MDQPWSPAVGLADISSVQFLSSDVRHITERERACVAVRPDITGRL